MINVENKPLYNFIQHRALLKTSDAEMFFTRTKIVSFFFFFQIFRRIWLRDQVTNNLITHYRTKGTHSLLFFAATWYFTLINIPSRKQDRYKFRAVVKVLKERAIFTFSTSNLKVISTRRRYNQCVPFKLNDNRDKRDKVEQPAHTRE